MLESDCTQMGQLEGLCAYLLWEQMFILPNAMRGTGSVVSVVTHKCIT